MNSSLREIIKTQHIPKLLADPTRGELLIGDLSGVRSYHFTCAGQQYRIAYLIEEETFIVFVLMIGKRSEFYTTLKQRIN